MKKTRVAIILVNWNGYENTIDCLHSISSLHKGIYDPLTIVVDNGSTNDSTTHIRKAFPNVTLLENNTNIGFSGGNNTGIEYALKEQASFIWLLNNDTIVDKNSLVSLIDALHNPGVGLVGSKIYFAKGHEYHSNRYKRSDLGHVLWYAGGSIDWNNMYAFHRGVDEVDEGQFDRVEETSFITGCSMMVRREVFEKIGLFDVKFFAYLEDLDLSERARLGGYSLLYVPSSIVWHKNAGSSGVGSQLHEYYMTRNRLLIGMRYASFATKFALVREGIKFILQGPPIRRKAIFDGFINNFGKQNI